MGICYIDTKAIHTSTKIPNTIYNIIKHSGGILRWKLNLREIIKD